MILPTSRNIVRVNLGVKAYDIVIGQGILPQAGEVLSVLLPSKKICIVTDEIVAKLYLVKLMKSLEEAGLKACPPIILPTGEHTKNFQQLQYIIDKSLSYKLDRSSTLVALGGGVIGDITGIRCGDSDARDRIRANPDHTVISGGQLRRRQDRNQYRRRQKSGWSLLSPENRADRHRCAENTPAARTKGRLCGNPEIRPHQ